MHISEYEFECGECSGKAVKLTLGDETGIFKHMTQMHGYNPEDIKACIQWYHDDVPQTENGDVLWNCPDHGEYVDVCYGCEAVDDAIDRWKESKHA